MPTYNVEVKVSGYKTYTIIASSESAAEDKAIDMAELDD